MRRAVLALAIAVGCSSAPHDVQTQAAPDPDNADTLTTTPPPGASAEADASRVDVLGDWAIDATDDPESLALASEPTEGTWTDADAEAAETDEVAEAPEGDSPADDVIEAAYRLPASASSATKPRCRKKIFATFLTYSYLPPIGLEDTNGCWKAERLMQDPIAPSDPTKMWRECHYDKDGHTGGSRWFYDDTNPNPVSAGGHDPVAELKRVARCNKPGGPGEEMLAPRPVGAPRWRIVNPRGSNLSTFFAELYYTEDQLDDLWLQSAVYRQNKYLRKYRRVSPMINVGYLYGSSGLFARARKIRNETLKVCRSMRKGQRMGIYAGAGRPLGGEKEADLRLNAVKHALDECTGVQATCGDLGGKICETGGNKACAGKGPPSAECDHCCGGKL